jgi:hypothetical protein
MLINSQRSKYRRKLRKVKKTKTYIFKFANKKIIFIEIIIKIVIILKIIYLERNTVLLDVL